MYYVCWMKKHESDHLELNDKPGHIRTNTAK
jgi:hypothetical protein